MSSVYFDPLVGGDGSTVTDDDNASTGLANGGAVIRLVPMFQQVVNVANYVLTKSVQVLSNANTAASSAATATAAANGITQLGTATGFQSTGAAVMVNASAPPVAKQILIATSPTTATWQDAPKTTPDFLLINAGII